MIKFIACDMDGTLVDDEKILHEKVFSTLDYLKSKNVMFCAASGRQYIVLNIFLVNMVKI